MEWFADFPRPKAGCTNAIPAKQLQGKQKNTCQEFAL